MKKWKSYPPWLKGFIIGALLGLFWAVSGILGTLICNWNPVEGSVVRGGICGNSIIIILLYLPTIVGIYASIPLILFLENILNINIEVIQDLPWIYYYFPGIVLLIITTLLGGFIGWIKGLTNKLKLKDTTKKFIKYAFVVLIISIVLTTLTFWSLFFLGEQVIETRQLLWLGLFSFLMLIIGWPVIILKPISGFLPETYFGVGMIIGTPLLYYLLIISLFLIFYKKAKTNKIRWKKILFILLALGIVGIYLTVGTLSVFEFASIFYKSVVVLK